MMISDQSAESLSDVSDHSSDLLDHSYSSWNMRPYFRQVKLSIQNLWVYRWDFFGDLVRYPITIAMHFLIFYFIFSTNSIIAGYTRSEGLTYILAVSMISRSLSQRGVANIVEQRILSGKLVNDITIPVHLSLFTFSRRTGYPIYLTVISIVVYAIACLVMPEVIIVPSLDRALLTIIFALIAMVLQMQIYYCIGLFTFWLKNIGFLTRVVSNLQGILGGRYFPVTWLPEVIFTVTIYLPFVQIYYLPVTILLGREPIHTGLLFLQLFAWVVLLQFLLSIIEKRGLRIFDGEGG